MAISLVCFYGQTGIEHENTTICPWSEEAALIRRRLERWIVLLDGFVDVYERRGCWGRWADREAQSMGLIDVMIWILPEDNGLDCI